MARPSIWTQRFNRDADFIVGRRSFKWAGKKVVPGDPFPTDGIGSRKVRQLYENRFILAVPGTPVIVHPAEQPKPMVVTVNGVPLAVNPGGDGGSPTFTESPVEPAPVQGVVENDVVPVVGEPVRKYTLADMLLDDDSTRPINAPPAASEPVVAPETPPEAENEPTAPRRAAKQARRG